MPSITSRPPARRIDFDRSRPALVLVERDPIRVLIADAQPVVRTGFRAMLERERDIEVAGMAGSAEEAVALVCARRPDVALIAVDLPGSGGLEAARRITEDPDCAGVGVIVLDPQDDDDGLFAALRAGARAFVSKSTERAGLLEAVRAVAAGDAFLSPSATRRLIAEFRSQPRPPMAGQGQLDELTAREREVTALVALGLRNDEIAERLVISPATVKTHVSRALRKLDAHDRSQLVGIAYRLGLVGTVESPRLRALAARPLAAASGAATYLG